MTPSVAETLTQAEMHPAVVTPCIYDPIGTLDAPGKLVWLLLPGFVTVEGWLATNFRTAPRTFWTWEPRFAKVSQFLAGVDPVVLAGCVEPVAWAAIEERAL